MIIILMDILKYYYIEKIRLLNTYLLAITYPTVKIKIKKNKIRF